MAFLSMNSSIKELTFIKSVIFLSSHRLLNPQKNSLYNFCVKLYISITLGLSNKYSSQSFSSINCITLPEIFIPVAA